MAAVFLYFIDFQRIATQLNHHQRNCLIISKMKNPNFYVL